MNCLLTHLKLELLTQFQASKDEKYTWQVDTFLILQRDFEVRELRDVNKQVNKNIGEIIHEHPDVGQALQMYFSQVSIYFLIYSNLTLSLFVHILGLH